MFMHGEDCATIANDLGHTRPRLAHERARQCRSPSCVSNDGAYAHGRTLNSRCHRTAGARERDSELVSPTSPNATSWRQPSEARVWNSPVLLRQGFGGHPTRAIASEGWWSRTGSNRRPEACKATALPTELRPQLRSSASSS